MPQAFLATAGIAFVVLVLAGVVYFVIKTVGAKRNKNAGEEKAPAAIQQEDPILRVRTRYEEIYRAVDVPGGAMILRIVTNSYLSGGGAARHYCWAQDGVLHMFPLWDSIAAAANAVNGADTLPREWRLPLADIICFAVTQGLPSKFVVLQFKMDSEVLTLSFGEEAARIFSQVMPQKDFSQLVEELYPKSSRNIYDIRESLQSLKELREEDLITEDEYAAKRKEVLILM